MLNPVQLKVNSKLMSDHLKYRHGFGLFLKETARSSISASVIDL